MVRKALLKKPLVGALAATGPGAAPAAAATIPATDQAAEVKVDDTNDCSNKVADEDTKLKVPDSETSTTDTLNKAQLGASAGTILFTPRGVNLLQLSNPPSLRAPSLGGERAMDVDLSKIKNLSLTGNNSLNKTGQSSANNSLNAKNLPTIKVDKKFTPILFPRTTIGHNSNTAANKSSEELSNQPQQSSNPTTKASTCEDVDLGDAKDVEVVGEVAAVEEVPVVNSSQVEVEHREREEICQRAEPQEETDSLDQHGVEQVYSGHQKEEVALGEVSQDPSTNNEELTQEKTEDSIEQQKVAPFVPSNTATSNIKTSSPDAPIIASNAAADKMLVDLNDHEDDPEPKQLEPAQQKFKKLNIVQGKNTVIAPMKPVGLLSSSRAGSRSPMSIHRPILGSPIAGDRKIIPTIAAFGKSPRAGERMLGFGPPVRTKGLLKVNPDKSPCGVLVAPNGLLPTIKAMASPLPQSRDVVNFGEKKEGTVLSPKKADATDTTTNPTTNPAAKNTATNYPAITTATIAKNSEAAAPKINFLVPLRTKINLPSPKIATRVHLDPFLETRSSPLEDDKSPKSPQSAITSAKLLSTSSTDKLAAQGPGNITKAQHLLKDCVGSPKSSLSSPKIQSLAAPSILEQVTAPKLVEYCKVDLGGKGNNTKLNKDIMKTTATNKRPRASTEGSTLLEEDCNHEGVCSSHDKEQTSSTAIKEVVITELVSRNLGDEMSPRRKLAAMKGNLVRTPKPFSINPPKIGLDVNPLPAHLEAPLKLRSNEYAGNIFMYEKYGSNHIGNHQLGTKNNFHLGDVNLGWQKPDLGFLKDQLRTKKAEQEQKEGQANSCNTTANMKMNTREGEGEGEGAAVVSQQRDSMEGVVEMMAPAITGSSVAVQLNPISTDGFKMNAFQFSKPQIHFKPLNIGQRQAAPATSLGV